MSRPIHQLTVGDLWNNLSFGEKKYAHHLSRAAWHGARIILRQTSPEALKTFDFILAMYRHYGGFWRRLERTAKVTEDEMQLFLDYAGSFLSNMGNYYGSGDIKIVPRLPREVFDRMAATSEEANKQWRVIGDQVYAHPPLNLGLPSDTAQSAYSYGHRLTEAEIVEVDGLLKRQNISPRNTRLNKISTDRKTLVLVMQACGQQAGPRNVGTTESGMLVRRIKGDHSIELKRICAELRRALELGDAKDDPHREQALKKLIESFEFGKLDAFRESQKSWVQDQSPPVENVFGFVEAFRDPLGVRAEFEGIVAIPSPRETRTLMQMVEAAPVFVKRLPWVRGAVDNDGKGPFEKTAFEAPEFVSLHALTYCSSHLFEGISLPAYSDIRGQLGFKNMIFMNRMAVESGGGWRSPYLDYDDNLQFRQHRHPTQFLAVVVKELLGHGTGRLLYQVDLGEDDRTYATNFKRTNPPVSPITGEPIASWYRPGQTYAGVFQDLAMSVEECRAMLVASYMIDDSDMLQLFGYAEGKEPSAEDVIFNKYQQLGDDGLRALVDYNAEDGSWARPESRAHWVTFMWVLRDGAGFLFIEAEPDEDLLIVKVKRKLIISHGKPSLERLLLRLHIWKCTADVATCRTLFEDLSKVEGEHLRWREVVLRNRPPKRKYVQANTFMDEHGRVTLKEYPPSDEGIIQSWAERVIS